jgi:hypothetical protein
MQIGEPLRTIIVEPLELPAGEPTADAVLCSAKSPDAHEKVQLSRLR